MTPEWWARHPGAAEFFNWTVYKICKENLAKCHCSRVDRIIVESWERQPDVEEINARCQAIADRRNARP